MFIDTPSLPLAESPPPYDNHIFRSRIFRRKPVLAWNGVRETASGYPSPPMSSPPSPTRHLPELSFPRSTSGERYNPPATTTVGTSGSAYILDRPTATSTTFGSSPYTPRALQSHARPATTFTYGSNDPTPGYGYGEVAATQFATPSTAEGESSGPRGGQKSKAHVASACINCKRAHLSCDVQRPCTRCVASGKQVSRADYL